MTPRDPVPTPASGPLTPEMIARLRELLGRMTPGEWRLNATRASVTDGARRTVADCDGRFSSLTTGEQQANAEGVALLKSLALSLLARLDELEAEVERLEQEAWGAALTAMSRAAQWSCESCAAGRAYRHAARLVREHEPQGMTWTRVEDGLPETPRISPSELRSANVLATNGDDADLACRYHDEQVHDEPIWFCDDEGMELGWEPTHWMPIPPVPIAPPEGSPA